MDKQDAVFKALGILAIEGLMLPDSARKIFQQIADGKMTTSEARQYQAIKVAIWRQNHPDWFWHGEPVKDPKDPCCYAGTNVLINKMNLINREMLSYVEGFMMATRLIDLYLREGNTDKAALPPQKEVKLPERDKK